MTDKDKLKKMITPIVQEIIREQIEAEVKQAIIATLLETNLISKIIEEAVKATAGSPLLENRVHENREYPTNVRPEETSTNKYVDFVRSGGLKQIVGQNPAASVPLTSPSKLEKSLGIPGIFDGITELPPESGPILESTPSSSEAASSALPAYMLREIAKHTR